MRIAPGTVVDGRVELDAEVPDGAPVTVLALEGDETFEADSQTENMLLDAMAEPRGDRVTTMKDLLADMRSREPREMS